MFPSVRLCDVHLGRLLHACGDVSITLTTAADAKESAPRMWRCFHATIHLTYWDFVCSTHVEMFLSIRHFATNRLGLLHACGDVSVLVDRTKVPSTVCSTHVEMFLSDCNGHREEPCLLHACGDVSNKVFNQPLGVSSAPRMWRCFPSLSEIQKIHDVCSTHVEMFLYSLHCLPS